MNATVNATSHFASDSGNVTDFATLVAQLATVFDVDDETTRTAVTSPAGATVNARRSVPATEGSPFSASA